MDLFEHSPHYAAHVEELEFTFHMFDIKKLVTIFPNARVIKVAHSHVRPFFSDYTPFRDPLATTSLNSKVQSLSDLFSCKLAVQLTTSNLCGRLETLDLFRFHNGDHVISELKNLPVLKAFKLHMYEISASDIDALHKNIPSIQDFSLVVDKIVSNQETSDIVPTATLETFALNVTHFTNLETHVRFYQYMTKKYANVLDIKCIDSGLRFYGANERRNVYSQAILDFIKLPGVTKSGGFSFYDFPDGFDIFGILNGLDAQISDLYINKCEHKTLFQYLSQSKQLQYIQKLKLVSTIGDTLQYIKAIPFLHTLNLSFSNTYANYDSYPVHEVIDLCPDTVTDLTINIYNLRRVGYASQLKNTRNLDIRYGHLTQVLVNIITAYFPNLVKLSVCSEALLDDVNIVLKSRLLQEASFKVFEVPDAEYGISFKSPYQKETEYYTCSPGNHNMVCSSFQKVQRLLFKLSIVSETNRKLESVSSRDANFKLINI